jgi:adenylate kinase family enzyme
MVSLNTNIIIIGPVGAGKSTQGQLLAKALNKRSFSLDNIANEYYEASSFSLSQFQEAKKEKGYLEAYQLWCPALAYAAQQVIKDYPDCVIDFGAGHSHYEDEFLFRGVKKALAHCPNIILLLPSSDLDRSVSLLRQRSIEERKRDWVHDGYDFIEHWVKDYCNHDLATVTIFTEGKTPEQTRDDILKAVSI